jgi:hypothetical protein
MIPILCPLYIVWNKLSKLLYDASFPLRGPYPTIGQSIKMSAFTYFETKKVHSVRRVVSEHGRSCLLIKVTYLSSYLLCRWQSREASSWRVSWVFSLQMQIESLGVLIQPLILGMFRPTCLLVQSVDNELFNMNVYVTLSFIMMNTKSVTGHILSHSG